MSVILILIIVLVIILIILLGTYILGLWKPATLPTANVEQMEMSYQIPSAWTSGAPTDNSTCQAYTFIGVNDQIPQPSLAALNANQSGKYTISSLNSPCVDDDQIFAQKLFHVCRYGELSDIPITQYKGCPLINGGATKINGYYEEFYNVCNPRGTSQSASLTADNSNRCIGSISLLTYNFTSSLQSATCLVDPLYTIEGNTVIMAPNAPMRVAHPTTVSVNPPVTTGGCNISDVQNGFPSQLFRVVRYSYDGSTASLTQDNSGPWVQIIHRQSGLALAPYTLNSDGRTPSVSSFNPTLSPILIDPSSFGNNGAWFYITPILIQPDSDVVEGSTPLTALPQLVWSPNIRVLGPIKDQLALWYYLTNPVNNVHSLVPFTINIRTGLPIYDRCSMIPFLTYQITASSSSILPPTDPKSPYYPTLSGSEQYAFNNSVNISSACYGYNASIGGFLIVIGGIYIAEPIMTNSECYQEYSLYLYNAYASAIAGFKQRIIAEYGAFSYIDLALIPIILNESTYYYDNNTI